MSETREVINPTGVTTHLTPEQKAAHNEKAFSEMSRAEKKAKLVEVLERGHIEHHLKVDLPPDLHGEWVPNDHNEITRMKALNFEIDTKYAPARTMHKDGTNSGQVGDVIFMTCPKDVYEIMQEIRHEQFLKRNSRGKTAEEIEYRNQVETQLGGTIPVIDEGKTTSVGADEIASTLK